MKILIITYNWPPRNAIGSHRPYSWAKYFTEFGADVTVLTPEKSWFDEPLDLNFPTPEGVTLKEIPKSSAGLHVNKKSVIIGLGMKLYKKITRFFGVLVDPRNWWVKPVLNDIDAYTDYDVIVSSYGPQSVHIIAYEMKIKYPHMKWVADYRDLWSLNCNRKHQKHLTKNLELRTVGTHADEIVTVSKDLAIEMNVFLGKNVHVVMNGFDVEKEDVQRRLNRRLEAQTDRKISIAYTGLVYEQRVNLDPLFRALGTLKSDQIIQAGRFEMQFLGGRNDQFLSELAQKFGVEDFIRLVGHVQFEESLQYQKNADALLLLESGRPEERGILTGKIFEYISAGRPVMSVGSEPDSAIGEVLSTTGCGYCFHNDEDQIYGFLARLYQGEPPDWFQPDIDKIMKYSRKEQAQKMFEIIKADIG